LSPYKLELREISHCRFSFAEGGEEFFKDAQATEARKCIFKFYSAIMIKSTSS
jgi:hypothetical protein